MLNDCLPLEAGQSKLFSCQEHWVLNTGPYAPRSLGTANSAATSGSIPPISGFPVIVLEAGVWDFTFPAQFQFL